MESPFFILNGNFGVQIGIVFLSPFVHLQIILLPSSLTKKKKKEVAGKLGLGPPRGPGLLVAAARSWIFVTSPT